MTQLHPCPGCLEPQPGPRAMCSSCLEKFTPRVLASRVSTIEAVTCAIEGMPKRLIADYDELFKKAAQHAGITKLGSGKARVGICVRGTPSVDTRDWALIHVIHYLHRCAKEAPVTRPYDDSEWLPHIRWMSWRDLLDAKRNRNEEVGRERWSLPHLLVLTDLGAEYSTEFASNFLMQVLESRLDDGTLTLATTNCTTGALIDRYGQDGLRLVDHLTQALEWVEHRKKP